MRFRNYKALSSVYGKIAVILLTLPELFTGEAVVEREYGEVFKSFEDSRSAIRWVVLVHPRNNSTADPRSDSSFDATSAFLLNYSRSALGRSHDIPKDNPPIGDLLVERYFRGPEYNLLTIDGVAGGAIDFQKELPPHNRNPTFNRLQVRCERLCSLRINYVAPNIGPCDLLHSIIKPLGLDSSEILRRCIEIEPNFRNWPEDPFLVLRDTVTRRLALLEPMDFRETSIQAFADYFIADHVCANSNIALEPSLFSIAGGNVLVSDDYALLGSDVCAKLLKSKEELNRCLTCPPLIHPPSGSDTLIDALRRQLGMQKLIWVNSGIPNNMDSLIGAYSEAGSLQPMYHIDLFLTLCGRVDVTVEGRKQARELVFVGRLDSNMTAPAFKDEEDDKSRKRAGRIKAYNQRLDAIAHMLEHHCSAAGGVPFHVHRIPIVYEQTLRGEFLYSYNNCLVEVYHEIDAGAPTLKKRVYLPSYRDADVNRPTIVRALQAALDTTRNRFRRYGGFETDTIDGRFFRYARNGGALNCMTKVLNRRDSVVRVSLE